MSIPSSFWFLPLEGKVGPIVCVGILLGVTCAAFLMGGGEVFLFFSL